jgi:hypothetical protein
LNYQLKNNCLLTTVTTGNAPNKLKAINNTVEDAYAISEENSDEQGTVNKLMSSQIKVISHQLL